MSARIIPLHRGKPFTIIEAPKDFADPIRFVKSDNLRVPDTDLGDWANALPRTALRPSGLSPVARSQAKPAAAFAACVDALADFIADVVTNPGLAFACAFGGLLTGMFATVGLAAIWAEFVL